jgi:hypothetical protein
MGLIWRMRTLPAIWPPLPAEARAGIAHACKDTVRRNGSGVWPKPRTSPLRSRADTEITVATPVTQQSLGYNGTLSRFGCGGRSYGRRVRWVTVPRTTLVPYIRDDPVGRTTGRVQRSAIAGWARTQGRQPASPSRISGPLRARTPLDSRTSFPQTLDPRFS